jgi:Na+-transporting methylmalonyl-CoA/oxaloacetate decarboxylase gamma subunit
MVGAVIVFLSVLALVFTYMWIVHRFLVSAEEPDDRARETNLQIRSKVVEPGRRPSTETQWAH